MARRPGLSPTTPKASVNDGNGNAIHNELLLGLSQAEGQGLFSKLELVRLKVHHLLHETGDALKSIYFCNSGMISILSVFPDGKSVEVGLVGKEGVIGLPQLVGFRTAPTRAISQIDATAFRVDGETLTALLPRLPTLGRSMQQYSQVFTMEIAHVAACHAARETTRGQLMNLASIPLIFVGGGIGYAAQNLAGLAFPMTFLKFSRGFETEADYLGVQYLYKAGYDPQAFTAFFEKVQALEKKKPGTLAKAFDTHPQTPDRMSRSQREIQTLLPPEPQYKLDSSEFQEVKARLAQLENRHKINDQKEGNRPTLRRGTPKPDDTTESGKDSGDEPPTLKRRPVGDQPLR